jgi:hypothetical protein
MENKEEVQDSFDLSEEEGKLDSKASPRKKEGAQADNEIEMVPGSGLDHRASVADMSRGNTSRSKYAFADDSDSDDEGAVLTRNSEFYRGDERDSDNKNMRNMMATG